MPKSRAATKILVLHEGMIGDISFDADVVRATLANGQRVTAKLAAAADGRMSPARTKAGIGPRLELSANCLLLYSVRQKPNLHNGCATIGWTEPDSTWLFDVMRSLQRSMVSFSMMCRPPR